VGGIPRPPDPRLADESASGRPERTVTWPPRAHTAGTGVRIHPESGKQVDLTLYSLYLSLGPGRLYPCFTGLRMGRMRVAAPSDRVVGK